MIYDKNLDGFFDKGTFFTNALPNDTNPLSNFGLFLSYFPNQYYKDTCQENCQFFDKDTSTCSKPNCQLVKNVSNWCETVNKKYIAVSLAFNEANDLIKYFNNHYKKKLDTSPYLTHLTMKYEAFMNCIYNFCESLSMLLRYMYPKNNLSDTFYKLRSNIINKKNTINDVFFDLMSKTRWYDEIHWIRTEATHKLFGFLYFSDEGKPGYLTQIFNKRESAPCEKDTTKTFKIEKNDVDGQLKIDIDNIEDHLRIIFEQFNQFITDLGDISIKLINPTVEKAVICFLQPHLKGYLIGTKILSLNDVLFNKQGRCTNFFSICPMKTNCEAYHNALTFSDENK